MVLKLEFDKEFEERFRRTAMNKFGYSKGSIKKAGKQALKDWINVNNEDLPHVKDPFKSIRGCMKHLRGKYTSVELQHEAVKLWAKEK